jgi:hypothetical protein
VWDTATRGRQREGGILTGAIWKAAKGPEVGDPTLSSYWGLLTEWVASPTQISPLQQGVSLPYLWRPKQTKNNPERKAQKIGLESVHKAVPAALLLVPSYTLNDR